MSKTQTIVPVERIESRILLIRGQKVMLDSDLAGLYGVHTADASRSAQPRPFSSRFHVPAEQARVRKLEEPIWHHKPVGWAALCAVCRWEQKKDAGRDSRANATQSAGRPGRRRDPAESDRLGFFRPQIAATKTAFRETAYCGGLGRTWHLTKTISAKLMDRQHGEEEGSTTATNK